MKKKEMLKEQKRIKEQSKEVGFDFSEKSDIKKVFYITVGVLLFIGLIFVLINIFNGTWKVFERKNNQEVGIDANLLMCGTLFNRDDKEYLVLSFNINNEDDALYSALVEKYQGDLPLYYLDLESGFNKNCIGERNNLVNDSSKIKFASQTLLHIKNGKIVKSYTTKDQIKAYFNKEK